MEMRRDSGDSRGQGREEHYRMRLRTVLPRSPPPPFHICCILTQRVLESFLHFSDCESSTGAVDGRENVVTEGHSVTLAFFVWLTEMGVEEAVLGHFSKRS